MYRPVFDIQKPGLIESVLTRAERVNAETPWIIGFSIDDDKTELRLTASLKKPVKRAFEIRLEPVVPHQNYTEDREFKDERKAQMKHLAEYLQDILDVEKTRDQHEHLDRYAGLYQKDIEGLTSVLSQNGEYAVTVSYTGDKEFITVNIRVDGSTQVLPLMQLVVELTPPETATDDESLAFKQNRNTQLSEIVKLVTNLIAGTRKESV